MQQGHVFVIDDDDELRNSIQDLLRFAGFTVRAWREPELFLGEIPEVAPAIVVTDMRMPGQTGLDLHQALIERGRRMPVIYISGQSSVHQSIAAMKLGAFDFLVKPFTREELLKAVAAGIEKDRQQMQSLIEQVRFNESLNYLTPREREVYSFLCKGYGNFEIVKAMNIALPTAKQFKSSVMRKLGVRSLSELLKLNSRISTAEKTENNLKA